MERTGLFCNQLQQRSIVYELYVTQLCVAAGAQSVFLTQPFYFSVLCSTLKCLFTFSSPPKTVCCIGREQLDLEKKRRIKRSVKSEGKNLIISSEHLIPTHTNTTAHPGNRLGSQSNTLCLIPPLLSSNQDLNTLLTSLQNSFQSYLTPIFTYFG